MKSYTRRKQVERRIEQNRCPLCGQYQDNDQPCDPCAQEWYERERMEEQEWFERMNQENNQ